MKEMITVNEVSKLAGISIRTLHYYDEIGLLKPQHKTNSKYRLYSGKDIEKLWQILFFKELDFPLCKIKEIINNPEFDKNEALKKHKKLLLEKRKRIDKIITSIDETIMKGFEINMIKTFNNENFEKHKEEAIEKYGNTAKQSYKRTSKYSKTQWEEINEEANTIYIGLAQNMDKGASDETIQQLVDQWKNHITKYYYDCTLEIFKGLGQLYVEDERFTKNIDKTKKGLAYFMKEAMDYYCENN
ncbi:MerR family transcriptional regulator [Oceanirhabdus sp. W0125-5]|uniref:MerR family transcriptional regulator n=1 Tax=Oceanirhabdus sp. W0125-5 TaxID=2999116 RepID=UPI0022F2BA68|nr:MerR family transcriptional regulator [Oceanirhabdus sp. W0125-5]WBW96807.1 MerR family transcriptional regulator [Oceanirhabdus sp. W0125-5]